MVSPGAPTVQGVYTNSEASFLRIPLDPSKGQSQHIVIVITQYGGFDEFGYTLRACFVNETANAVYRFIPPTLTALPPVIPGNYHVEEKIKKIKN